MTQFSTFFALVSSSDRQQWLEVHCPQRSDELITELWAEATRYEQNAPHTAQAVVDAARDLVAIWQDRELEAIALRIEASMQRALGHHDTALLRYQAAINLYHQLGMADDAARTTVGPLDTLMYLGQYDKALQLANMAISKMRAIGDSAVLGRLLVNQGNIYARTANYSSAQQAYAEARQLFTVLDQPQHLAMVEANEANVLTNLNDFRQAEQRYLRARAHFAAAALTGAVAQVDHNLAYLAFAQGDYQQALQRFAEARTLFETQQNAVDVAYVDLYHAEIYLALNLWPEALAVARTARPTFDEALMQWEAAQLRLIEAASLMQLGYDTTADAVLTHAHQLFTAERSAFWVAVTEVNQGLLAWRQADRATAQRLLHKSHQTFVATGVPSRAAQCAVWLGDLALVLGNDNDAAVHFQRALDTVDNTPLPAITYACHYGLARIHQQRGEIDAAIDRYNLAVTDIERVQATIGAEDYKIAFRRDKLPIYEALMLLYLEQHTPDAMSAAFALVERAKARGLLDTMARMNEERAIGIPDELLTQYEALKRELNWVYHRLHTPAQKPMKSSSVAGPASSANMKQTWRIYERNGVTQT